MISETSGRSAAGVPRPSGRGRLRAAERFAAAAGGDQGAEHERVADLGVDDRQRAEPEDDRGERGHGRSAGRSCAGGSAGQQLLVELQGEAGGLVPGVGTGGGGAGGGGQLLAGGGVVDQLAQRARQRGGVAGRDESRGAGLRHLGEAADRAHHQRLAEGEAGVEDAGMLGVEVGQRDDVGAAEDRRDLGLLDEAGDEADLGAGQRRQLVQRLDRHPRVADDPELRLPHLAERLEQVLEALVGTEQAEGEDDRALGALELRRQRLLLGQAGEVVEGPVGDHPHALGRQADLVAKAGGAVLGVGDDRVHRAEDLARGSGRLGGSRRGAGCSGRSSPAAGSAAGGAGRARAGSATGSGRRRRRSGRGGRRACRAGARRP